VLQSDGREDSHGQWPGEQIRGGQRPARKFSVGRPEASYEKNDADARGSNPRNQNGGYSVDYRLGKRLCGCGCVRLCEDATLKIITYETIERNRKFVTLTQLSDG
jgi:hypothetical protein